MMPRARTVVPESRVAADGGAFAALLPGVGDCPVSAGIRGPDPIWLSHEDAEPQSEDVINLRLPPPSPFRADGNELRTLVGQTDLNSLELNLLTRNPLHLVWRRLWN